MFYYLNCMGNDYWKRIIVNECKLMELFDKTKDQSANSLWHEVRSY